MRFESTLVYSKSFKGLPNGWKPISNVTFIVGENSSGKTSLFDLLSLLDSPNLNIFSQILGSVDFLDHANDVITRFGNEHSVTVGYVADTLETFSGERQYVGILVTSERDGDLLATTQTSILEGRSLTRIRFREGAFEVANSFISVKDESVERIADWIERSHFTDRGAFKPIDSLDTESKPNTVDWLNARVRAVTASPSTRSKAGIRSPFFMNSSTGPLASRRYGPIRTEAQRIFYERRRAEFDPTGSHYPFFLRQLIKESPNLLEAVKQFGIMSGLFDSIRIAMLSGDGAEAFSILYEKFGKEFHADELGFGLGQIVPIVTDLLTSGPPLTFLIQQPEVHLHPKAQAAFGDLMHQVALGGCALVVETHSDFIIDRFRIAQATSEKKVEANVLFFEKSMESDRPIASVIPVSNEGRLVGAPDSYREFFVNEAISVFEAL